MSSSSTPYPRYRLYTAPASYREPWRYFFIRKGNRPDMPARLELELCRRFDVAAAVCVPMARTGVYLAVKHLIRPGQTVVMSPLTIVDVVNAVVLAGGIPLFADIDRRSCAIDPDQAESLIDGQTGAVLITHLHGETAGAHRFRQVCDRRGVPLIEDAAQAFGATEEGKRLGTVGDAGIYSFGTYKNVNAWRGGIIVSQDRRLISRIRTAVAELPELPGWRLLARSLQGLVTDAATWPPLFVRVTYPVVRFGFLHEMRQINRWLDPEDVARRLAAMPQSYFLNMNRCQAELVLRQLDGVDCAAQLRITNAHLYHQALDGVEDLITPKRHEGLSHVYTCYPIQVRERQALLRHAMSTGRDFAAQHLRNCADLTDFREFRRDCPNARAAARELVLLPTYPGYPEREIRCNIKVICELLETGTGRRA